MDHEQSAANSIEEDGWIFGLDHEHAELCELIMIDSGASQFTCVHLTMAKRTDFEKSIGTRPLSTASGSII